MVSSSEKVIEYVYLFRDIFLQYYHFILLIYYLIAQIIFYLTIVLFIVKEL
jgi:hypothetical protein